MRTFSVNGIKLIEMFEEREYEVYPDSGGALTIGIGHLLTKSNRTSGKIKAKDKNGVEYYIRYNRKLNDTEVEDILRADLAVAEEIVNKEVKVILTQYQYDALVSFTFNVGNTAFKDSTLLKLLNKSKYDDVPTQMRRWNRDNGEIVSGLINRREKEIKVWENRMEIENLQLPYSELK